VKTADRTLVCDDDWAFQSFEGGIEELVAAEEAGLVDPMEFRRHVSLFATGVAVITTEDLEGVHHGVTVNSFGSISLEPPTVMVSLRKGRAHDAIKATGRYGASILGRDQRVHSAHFAGNRENTERPEIVVRHRVPTLGESLAWFECEVHQELVLHDHVLFFARVTACGGQAGDPLIFFASQYTRPADVAW
jgi:flavin reductase (DIM6/NTAB) family NADH-FMN oxidoreductase RutF